MKYDVELLTVMKQDGNLTKNIETVGTWYLPRMKKQKTAGVFKYENGQILVDFQKHLPFKSDWIESVDYPIVFGDTRLGPVTLTKVSLSPYIASGHAYTVVVGKHLKKDSFKHLAFGFDILTEWTMQKMTQQGRQHYKFTYDGITCELSTSVGRGVHAIKGSSNYRMSSFIITTKKYREFTELIKFIHGIKYFLMICTGRNMTLDFMTSYIDNKRCDIYLPTQKYDERGHFFEHYINLPSIEKRYSKILTKWMEFYFKNKFMIDMFCDTMNKRTIDIFDFYAYAATLNGYYKATHKIKQEPKIDEDKFKMQVKDVLKSFETDSSNLPQFINEVVKARHDMFHFNERDTLDPEPISRLTHDLYFLIRILLLNQVGINLKLADLQQKPKFIYLKRN
ncbi:MAG: hypothetical protein IIC67_01645 [Thaumarchaeota archaeon]|nr:hypothetical protein [Nitrososphaerota archaeon]